MPNWVQTNLTITGPTDQLDTLAQILSGNNFSFKEIIPMPPPLDIPAGSDTDMALIYTCYEKYGAAVTDVPDSILKDIDEFGFAGLWDPENERIAADAQDVYENKIYEAKKALSELKDGTSDFTIPKASAETPLTVPVLNKRSFSVVGEMMRANILNYGSSTWYNWCRKNWGTKWDASDVEFRQEENSHAISLSFQTAWSVPMPIIEAMSKMYPKLEFNGEYADENIGSNCGRFTLQNGNGSVVKPSKVDLAIRLACDVWGYDADEYLGENDKEE